MRHDAYNGALLEHRRLAIGMSLSEVSEQVRIPVSYIQALEKGKLAKLPPPCYTIGFLRSYCRFLGVNPETFVAAYHTGTRQAQRTIWWRLEDAFERAIHMRASNLLSWATVLAAVLAGWVTYAVIFQPDSQPLVNSVEAASLEIVLPPSPPSETDFLDF